MLVPMRNELRSLTQQQQLTLGCVFPAAVCVKEDLYSGTSSSVTSLPITTANGVKY